jgi:hypothetical protein
LNYVKYADGLGPILRSVPRQKSGGVTGSCEEKIVIDHSQVCRQFRKNLWLWRVPSGADSRITNDRKVIAAPIADVKPKTIAFVNVRVPNQLQNLVV